MRVDRCEWAFVRCSTSPSNACIEVSLETVERDTRQLHADSESWSCYWLWSWSYHRYTQSHTQTHSFRIMPTWFCFLCASFGRQNIESLHTAWQKCTRRLRNSLQLFHVVTCRYALTFSSLGPMRICLMHFSSAPVVAANDITAKSFDMHTIGSSAFGFFLAKLRWKTAPSWLWLAWRLFLLFL